MTKFSIAPESFEIIEKKNKRRNNSINNNEKQNLIAIRTFSTLFEALIDD